MGYKFHCGLPEVGDGRPDLKMKVPLALRRLLHFALRDVLEGKYGTKAADEAFFAAGKLAGAEFYTRYIEPVAGLDKFINKTQRLLEKGKIGIFKIEADLQQGRVLLTIDEMEEDLYGFGPPTVDYEVCSYNEGFISALFGQFTRKWRANDIDCWCTGAKTCRFLVKRNKFSLQPKGRKQRVAKCSAPVAAVWQPALIREYKNKNLSLIRSFRSCIRDFWLSGSKNRCVTECHSDGCVSSYLQIRLKHLVNRCLLSIYRQKQKAKATRSAAFCFCFS